MNVIVLLKVKELFLLSLKTCKLIIINIIIKVINKKKIPLIIIIFNI
jgi:hypothetical protein